MLVYLEHPQHGVHIAYSQSEVDECYKNGWKIKKEPAKTEPKPVVKETIKLKAK